MTNLVAALDLGSNSFHVTLVDISVSPYRVVERLGEKVQLGAGLDENNQLSQAAIDRGLACIERLACMLVDVSPKQRYIVATNTLRVAVNRAAFMEPAQRILDAKILLLSGEQEAAYIFKGVIGDQACAVHQNATKLVIDIGGGSTEIVLGQHTPIRLHSFEMGCVSYSKAYFPDRRLNQSCINEAARACEQLITQSLGELPFATKPGELDRAWRDFDVCIGSSGTIKALIALSDQTDNGLPYIDAAAMRSIETELLVFKHLDEVNFEGVRADRGEVLPAGYAILKGIMMSLQIQRVYFSTGALREGVLLASANNN